MSLYFHHLDERTRRLMLEEVEYDLAHNQLHISPFLSGQGQQDYANLLREAIRAGNDETLAQSVGSHRRINRSIPRRKPKGGFTVVATPVNAATVLAEGEFNRFYMRALARRAMEDGITDLVIYRAKSVNRPRVQSETLVETTVSAQALLDDLRAH